MEDAHTTVLSLIDGKKISFFGVFDGHGGSTVAKFAGEKLHTQIAETAEFKDGNFKDSLKSGFLSFDLALSKEPVMQSDSSGCTSVTILITEDNRLFCANAGDSRAVLSRGGGAIPLSQDHKPTNPEEINRITMAGGFVEFGRVNGNLALSRALGDFEFKDVADLPPEQQIVTANPDITEQTLDQNDEFVVLACDGIWDVLSNQQVVDFVRERLLNHGDLAKAAEELMDRCLAKDSDMGGVGCDNMTVIIVGTLLGRTQEQWIEAIKSKAGDLISN
ncbi:phosphatase 2C-like domain-containing protein [Polychytrium aggregatum]|uniref:phosphatase 2C-like domain-containing protein n=1 Tax=Polychytrium aggregatum TaxID=110093 RepID=UPI0022FEB7D3|nr:phosphatase 2C-like domain-containing protein [Polychytrium aggregatum]KAI9204755.1 phosphatase 2C-like domain-containing protein [Polychytrium aggregatum]